MIAFHIGSFIYLNTIVLASLLTNGYLIPIALYSIHICRLSLYMAVVLSVLCPCYLIFASIDRILLTSANATTRQRSTSRLACVCIISVTLFWFICHVHVLVYVNIIQVTPNYSICYFPSGTYSTNLSYYSTIRALLIPLILGSLGVAAVKNVRQISLKRVPAFSTNIGIGQHTPVQHTHSKDRQLIRILLTDVVLYFVLSFPLSIITLYLQIIQHNVKTYEQTQINTFIQYTCAIAAYIPFCTGFYINLFISKTFRNEIKNVFLCQ
ncbi:unnamed protein product [Adineta ricciae]|nr:unnamed protein product [Adineta ricciae]